MKQKVITVSPAFSNPNIAYIVFATFQIAGGHTTMVKQKVHKRSVMSTSFRRLTNRLHSLLYVPDSLVQEYRIAPMDSCVGYSAHWTRE